MKDWNYEQIINALRSIVALVFLCFVGVIFLYSKFTEKPLDIVDIQLILGVLLPYFGLDIAFNLNQIKQQNKDKE